MNSTNVSQRSAETMPATESPLSRLRVAIVAPLTEPVPPPRYGGTERVVSILAEELVRRGHDVTLFASRDSETSARLIPCCDNGLRLDTRVTDYFAYAMTEMGEVSRRANDFDLIHNHIDYFAFPTARLITKPTLSTTHGRLDLPEVQRVYGDFSDLALVSISHNQRAYLPQANWINTVYNAVDISQYRFQPEHGDYLVFLGRISPEKRPDRAIDIARDVDMKLIIAAKIDPVDHGYWVHAIEPLVRANRGLVEYVGEVDEQEKNEILGGAWAYLFPIDWPEPFGLTMAESMATGTPVIAYRAGSVPEVIESGVTGFVCNSFTEMVQAVDKIGSIDRAACRRRVEMLFSPEVMTTGYEKAYADLLQPADDVLTNDLPSPPEFRDEVIDITAPA
jgi:glycosyltransferase involved in cell wall biosynthesis